MIDRMESVVKQEISPLFFGNFWDMNMMNFQL